MSVNVTLTPLGPASRDYAVVRLGDQYFVLTHLKGDGSKVEHTVENWESYAQNLGTLCPSLFDDELRGNLEAADISLSDGRVTYICKDEETEQHLRVDTAMRNGIQELCKAVRSNTPAAALKPLSIIQGTFSQYTSPVYREDERVRSACTAIVAEVAEKCVTTPDASHITPEWIDDRVVQGQKKFLRILQEKRALDRRALESMAAASGTPQVENHIHTGQIDLPKYFPLLEKSETVVRQDIAQEKTEESYVDLLLLALPVAPVAVASIICRGETFAVIVYRGENRQVKKVVYFDSHPNRAGKAHAHCFDTLNEAAAFLAVRKPWGKATENNPEWNAIEVTPLVLNRRSAQLNALHSELPVQGQAATATASTNT